MPSGPFSSCRLAISPPPEPVATGALGSRPFQKKGPPGTCAAPADQATLRSTSRRVVHIGEGRARCGRGRPRSAALRVRLPHLVRGAARRGAHRLSGVLRWRARERDLRRAAQELPPLRRAARAAAALSDQPAEPVGSSPWRRVRHRGAPSSSRARSRACSGLGRLAGSRPFYLLCCRRIDPVGATGRLLLPWFTKTARKSKGHRAFLL